MKNRRLELPVVQRAYDLVKEILVRSAKFPRDYKYSLGERMVRLGLDMLGQVVAATYTENKLPSIEAASVMLEQMRFLVRLANELGPISHSGYGRLCAIMEDLGRQLGGWRKQVVIRAKDT